MRKTTHDQITNPNFLRDARNYTALHMFLHKIEQSQMLDHITDLYRDLGHKPRTEPITEYCPALAREREVFLDMECFEVPGSDQWLRNFGSYVPRHVNPFLPQETRPRGIALTSILRANDPFGTRYWGTLR